MTKIEISTLKFIKFFKVLNLLIFIYGSQMKRILLEQYINRDKCYKVKNFTQAIYEKRIMLELIMSGKFRF